MDQSKREQVTDWVKDKSVGQAVDDTGRKPSIAGDLVSVRVETFVVGGRRKRDLLVSPEGSWELITNAGASAGVTKYTESNSACPCAGVEEINGLPRWG